jgi:hypothetical protein
MAGRLGTSLVRSSFDRMAYFSLVIKVESSAPNNIYYILPTCKLFSRFACRYIHFVHDAETTPAGATHHQSRPQRKHMNKTVITFSGTNFSVNYRGKLAPLLDKGKLLLFISFAKTFEKNALLR